MITKEKLKEITELAESVPNPFKLKCFELILKHQLSTQLRTNGEEEITKEETKKEITKQTFIVPIDVKAFLNQYSLNEKVISKLYLIEGNNIRPIYNLKVHKKARAQIQHALLMSLENALVTQEFKFSVDSLRRRCKDLKCFDTANFMTILKKSSPLFKSLDDEEAVCLSTDGKAELADVIEELVNE